MLSVPFLSVSIEEHTSRHCRRYRVWLCRYAETGGELTVMGLPYVQVCVAAAVPRAIGWLGYTTVAPSVSLERLEKLVIAENKPDWA